MCEIMKKVQLIKHTDAISNPKLKQERTLLFDMWLVLKGDHFKGITKRNLLVFIFAILGLKYSIPLDRKK